jgi:hypothetical protein
MNDALTDEDQIKETVENVHRYRDHAMWDKITDYFIDKPYIDDTELTSEAAGQKSIKELIANWRNELRSYFYATRHRVQSMSVSLDGKKHARATSPIKTQFFLSDKGLRYVLDVEGTYHYDLVKKSGRWKIGELTFRLKNQTLKQIGL